VESARTSETSVYPNETTRRSQKAIIFETRNYFSVLSVCMKESSGNVDIIAAYCNPHFHLSWIPLTIEQFLRLIRAFPSASKHSAYWIFIKLQHKITIISYASEFVSRCLYTHVIDYRGQKFIVWLKLIPVTAPSDPLLRTQFPLTLSRSILEPFLPLTTSYHAAVTQYVMM
jgi:hypothetical protein